MPLREEVRVFYNMDRKKIEYMVDYWDYDYCYDNLCLTDKIIFNWFHNKTQERPVKHKDILGAVKMAIEYSIRTLKFDGVLKGIWSIDFMYVHTSLSDDIYLIDMARGERSAYWDVDKLK